MSAPTTRMAYTDCYDIYDQALEHPHGIRMRLVDYDKANHLRMRLHQARKIDREDNARQYEPGQPLYGSSVYDALQIRIRTDTDNCTWLYIEPRTADIIGEIEPLSQVEAPLWLEQNSPPKLISHIGTTPSNEKSDSSSDAPIESSLSTPSTQPDKLPAIQNLRRL